MDKKEPTQKTKQEVYKRWKGKCAFCGIDLPVEEHHIIAIKDDPSLIDNPDNLILLCSNHHSLTQKIKPNGIPAISFMDIQDLKQSRFATLEKRGFYFEIPQNFTVSLGNNLCSGCPYVLVVNRKPLIEMWPQKTTHYSKEVRFYLYMRFFDGSNNFIGGMFANHWASVVNEEWKVDILENEIKAQHRTKLIFVKFEREKELVYITGEFYFDGIKIIANKDMLILPVNNKFIENRIQNCEVAFSINGNNKSAAIGIGGNLI